MFVKTFISAIFLASAADAFSPSHRSLNIRKADTALGISDVVLAQSPNEIVNTIIPLTITASAFYTTIARSSPPKNLEWMDAFRVTFDEAAISQTAPSSSTAAAAVVEESAVPAPVMETAPATTGEVAVGTPLATTVVETPSTVSGEVQEEAAPALVAESTTAVVPASTTTTPEANKSGNKLFRAIVLAWVSMAKRLAKFLRILYLPWLALIPKFSRSSS